MSNLVSCIYVIITLLPNGSKYREAPMLNGVVIKESPEQTKLLVDFSKELKKRKASLYWNTPVIYVRSNDCVSLNFTK